MTFFNNYGSLVFILILFLVVWKWLAVAGIKSCAYMAKEDAIAISDLAHESKWKVIQKLEINEKQTVIHGSYWNLKICIWVYYGQ